MYNPEKKRKNLKKKKKNFRRKKEKKKERKKREKNTVSYAQYYRSPFDCHIGAWGEKRSDYLVYTLL